MTVLGFDVRSSTACSFIDLPYQVDPEEQRIDHTPPAAFQVSNVEVARGRGPIAIGGGISSFTSCDDIGAVTFALGPPRDDRTPSDEIGIEARVVGGTPPAGLNVIGRTLVLRDARFTLHWIDGATDVHQPLDFTVVLVSVDRAGNRGAPSEPIHVESP